jgi:hypothetical protein
MRSHDVVTNKGYLEGLFLHLYVKKQSIFTASLAAVQAGVILVTKTQYNFLRVLLSGVKTAIW